MFSVVHKHGSLRSLVALLSRVLASDKVLAAVLVLTIVRLGSIVLRIA